jgi:hypothetical protein
MNQSSKKFQSQEQNFNTKQQIAAALNIDIKTLRRLLRRKNIEIPRGYICPADVRQIFDAIGWPEQG